MDADWITSPSARRVLQHDADPRPAWLWSQDGQRLLWQNAAAGLFLAKIKKHGLKRSEPAVPIKGQVARTIRLGSFGRTSLSRVQFLAGDRPAFATCACTPLLWQNDEPVLLIVGVDPIDRDILTAAPERVQPQAPMVATEPAVVDEAAEEPVAVAEEPAAEHADDGVAEPQPEPQAEPANEPIPEPVMAEEPLPPFAEPQMAEAPADNPPEIPEATAEAWVIDAAEDADMREVQPQPDAAEFGAQSETEPMGEAMPEPDVAEAQAPAEPEMAGPPADPIGAVIEADEQAYERELDNWRDAEPAPAPETGEVPREDGEAPAPDMADIPQEPARGRLGALFDRMAEKEELYTPLTEADDEPPRPVAAPMLYKVTGRGFMADRVVPAAEEEGEADIADLARLDESAAPAEPEQVTDVIAEAVDATPETEAEAGIAAEPEGATGADIVIEPEAEAVPPPSPVEPASLDDVAEALTDIVKALEDATPKAVDEEAVERVSRYNFDELSRILNERVGDRGPLARGTGPVASDRQPRAGELVNLGGETLVLNRLPLGILVFRDQQVLFANRAITEMIGYDSVETLRNAGLAAIFPAQDREDQQAGPVNHLVQRDGTLVPVTARLQSISWQGRPALMLSASMTEVRTGHEDAVRAFAEMFAATRGDGFILANRVGVIEAGNARAAALLNQDERPLHGKALSAVVAAQDLASLREFLERPARFAETARPAASLRGTAPGSEIMLFAQGQAGIITGYFGLVHRSEVAAPLHLPGGGEAEPALLARISRGVRRPLNTIVGFADLIRSEAFGALGNERYERYAQDIGAAGQEIAALVDELDDYTRLRDGRYLPHRASIDLLALLESCVVRIRPQASLARVIVRSAISEKLPKVTADRASLVQAVLNLLASAVDQTPTGGAVVISAQREEDGAIAVHVRDSSTNAVDMAERFVVFRDGIGRNGQALAPVRSSVGLALTRSLLAVNAVSLSVDPAGSQGMLFSLLIPADLVDRNEAPKGE